MTKGKFSDKLKIVAVILAVVVVAGAAIAYTALSGNASDSQASLSAGSNGVSAAERATSQSGVSISADGNFWETNKDVSNQIGTYSVGTYGVQKIISTVAVEAGVNVTDIRVEGKTLDGQKDIDGDEDINIFYDTENSAWKINLTEAGNYKATVEIDNTTELYFFAQIGKMQVEDLSFKSTSNNKVYTGDPYEITIGTKDTGSGYIPWTTDGIFEITSIEGHYTGDNNAIIGPQGIEFGYYAEGNGCVFKVTDAGVYTITAKLTDDALHNLEWKNHKETNQSVVTGFTVKQAYVKGKFQQYNVSSVGTAYGYKGDEIMYSLSMDKSTLDDIIDLQIIDQDGVPIDNVVGEIGYFKNAARNDRITDFVEYGTGTVYAKLEGLVGANGDDTTYRNYRIAGNSSSDYDEKDAYNRTRIYFDIVRNNSLNQPVANSKRFNPDLPEFIPLFTGAETHFESNDTAHTARFETEYRAFNYQVWLFFNNWDGDSASGGYESGQYWNVTVSDAEGNNDVKVNPNDIGSKIRDVGTYKIKITPVNNNYAWTGDDGGTWTYTLTIVVKPYKIQSSQVTLHTNHFVYTGEPMSVDTVTYDTDLWGDDTVELELIFGTTGRTEIKDSDGNITGREPIIHAGQYSISVIGISGPLAKNYYLPVREEVSEDFPTQCGFSYLFEVRRKQMTALPDGVFVEGTFTFNGDMQQFDKAFQEKMFECGWATTSVNDQGETIYDLFGLIKYGSITVSPTLSGNGQPATGATTVYGIDFGATYAGYYSLMLQYNSDSCGNDYCWPGGDDYWKTEPDDYELKNFVYIAPASFNPALENKIIAADTEQHIDLAQQYMGLVNGGTTPVYTVTFGKGATTSPVCDLDWDSANNKYIVGDNYYVLLTIKDEFEGSFSFIEGDGVQLLNDGKQARMNYIVSDGMATATVAASGYTFGDNLGASGITIANKITVSTNMPESIQTANITYEFFTDAAMTADKKLSAGDLANGLPRNAGTYYVKATVPFNGQEEPCVATASFVVDKMSLALTWKVDGETANTSATLTYNKAPHAVAVSASPISGTDISVSIENATGLVNAGTYNWTSASLTATGADSENYTLTNTSFSLQINKIDITVTAQGFNIVFGQSVTESQLTYALTGEFLTGDFNDEIKVYVYANETSSERITDLSALVKGNYVLRPVWTGAEQPVNYNLTINTATLTVAAQSITITLKSGGSSQYGYAVDLYTDAVVAGVTGLPNGEDYRNYITITATNGSGTSVTASRAPVGTYNLNAHITDANGDYTLNVAYAEGNGATFEITRREVTLQAVDYERGYGEYSLISGDYTEVQSSILPEDLADKTVVISGVFGKYGPGGGLIVNSDDPSAAKMDTYYHVLKLGSSLVPWSSYQRNSTTNRYACTVNSGNYRFTLITGFYKVVARTLTITFTDSAEATSVYGEAIDLFRQSDEVANLQPGDDIALQKRKASEFIVLTVSNLMYYSPANHKLTDVINLILVDEEGTEYSGDRVPAGTYGIKVTVKKDQSYVLAGAAEDGTLVGGAYVVTQREINVTTTANKTSVTYGNTLEDEGITLSYVVTGGSLLSGTSLNETTAIFSSATNQVVDISTQGVDGQYYVGMSYDNPNYKVNVTTVPFTVAPRAITITPQAVTNHVYGDALKENELNYEVTSSFADAIVSGDNLNITLVVQNGGTNVTEDGIKKLVVGDYAIKVNYDETNVNYTVTPVSNVKFTVVKRAITIAAKDVIKHVYGEALKEGELDYEVTSTNQIVNDDDLGVTLAVQKDGINVPDSEIKDLAVNVYAIDVWCTSAKANNYDITYDKTAKFHVVTLKIEITYINTASSVYGEKVNIESAYSVEGLIEGDTVNVTIKLEGDDSVSATSSAAPVGKYVVTVTAGANYEVTYTNGTTGVYNITKREITITANAVSNVYGDAIGDKLSATSAYTVTANSSYENSAIVNNDDLNIALVVYNGGTAVNNNAIPTLDGGDYNLKVTYTSNPNYNVTVVETAKFTVTPRALTLTFTAQGGTAVYGNTIDLYDTSVGELSNFMSDRHTYQGLITLSLTKDGSEVVAANPSVDTYVVTATLKNGLTNNYTLTTVGAGKYTVTPATLTDVTTVQTSRTVNYTGSAYTFTAVSGKQISGESATVRYILTNKGVAVGKDSARWDTSDASATVPQVTNAGNYTLHVLVSAANHNSEYLTSDLIINSVTLTVTAKPVTVKYGYALALNADNTLTANDYTHATSSELSQTVLNNYFNALTYTTNYTTATAAGAQNITVTPVYSPAADGNVNVVCESGAVTVENADITITKATSKHPSGYYTGAAFELFDELEVSGIKNSQPVTWYYSDDNGATWTKYDLSNPATLTNVCSKTFKVRATALYHNDDVYSQGITFVISQNSITITLDDKSVIYGDNITSVNFTAALTSSANGLLSTDNYVSATAAAREVSGYTTTTPAGSKLDITSTYTGDANVAVTVVKGELTVNARTITITFTDNGGSSVYGDPANISGSSVFTYSCVFANSDKLTDVVSVSAEDADGVAMAQTNPHAGSYTVSVTLANNNYSISFANAETGLYTITKRPISVTLPEANASVEYTEDGGNLHGGVYGAAHNAVLTGELINSLTLNTDYTVTYNTLESEGQVANAAPTKAGEYVVTVTLTNDNYIFAGDKTAVAFDFVVTQKVLYASDFTWENHVINYAYNESNANVILAYNADIMDVVTFTKTTASQQNNPVRIYQQGDSEADKDNYYYFNGEGQLCVNVLGRARYEVTFNLNAAASNNYIINGAVMQRVTAAFHIASISVTLTVNVTGWQYTDTPTASNFVVAVNGDKPLYGLDYYIMPFVGDNALWNTLLAKHNADNFGGIASEEMPNCYGEKTAMDLNGENLATTLADLAHCDVGRYVIYVEYDGVIGSGEDADFTHIQMYDILEISKKELQAYLPTFEAATYNGQEQSLVVNFDQYINDVKLSDIINASFDSSPVTSGSSIGATNKGSYEVSFSVKPSFVDRYIMSRNSADAAVVWVINKDTAPNNDEVSIPNFDGTYGIKVTLPTPTTKTGYEGSFTWQFATKVDDNRPDEFSLNSTPINAGSYWVKLTLSDTNDNFGDKVTYAVFTVEKATLRVRPRGEMTYGNVFAQGMCNYDIVQEDLKYKDTPDKLTVDGSIKYKLKDTTLNPNKLEVSTYGYALTEEECSLVAENYEIQVVDGNFTVKPLPVTVCISGVANRQYGWAIDLSSVDVTEVYDNVLAKNELLAYVKNTLFVAADDGSEATATSPVGVYAIMSKYDDKNFAITWQNGAYEIVEREVTVSLINGGGTYSMTIDPAQYTATIRDANNAESTLAESEGFAIAILYDGSETKPVNAGLYEVTISVSGNANYKLVNQPTLTFVVEKFEVDPANITTAPQMYTGLAIKPQIVDKTYEQGIYSDVSEWNTFVASGPYDVTLRLSDTNNYKWKNIAGSDATITFTIAKADIYAIPSATITYGTAATDSTVTLKFVYAENGAAVPDGVVKTNASEIEYIFVNNDINRDRPEAGTYKFTMKTENGFVCGCSSDDYNIALQKNGSGDIVYADYVVDKKPIIIVAGSSSSIYYEEVVLSNDYELKGGFALAWDDKLEDVVKGYEPSCEATKLSDVGPYEVTATVGEHKNYLIEVKPGTHTISQFAVDVTLTAKDGEYGGTIAIVKVESITAPAQASMLTIVYSGVQYDGTRYNESKIPTNAGSYTATVTDISSKNFVLGTVNSVDFIVAKHIVDQDAIVIESKTYNGHEQAHGLTNTVAYTVSDEMFKDAGSHDVILTLTSGYNYAWKDTTELSVRKQFVINKAQLTITPKDDGTFTYGDRFASSQSKLGFTVKGLLGDDTEAVIGGEIRYSLAGGLNGDKLAAKADGYDLVADVSALTATNYTIEAKTGKLIVSKRNVTIQPVESSSVYSQPIPAITDFVFINGTSLVEGDNKSAITFSASIQATSASNVGEYDISATATSNNYNVKVEPGKHVIVPIKVGVVIRPVDREYGSNKEGEAIAFITTVTTNLGDEPQHIGGLKFVINYSGTSNNNLSVDSDTVPTLAGMYTVTVRDVDNDNYTIDRSYGIHTTVVVIERKAVDASKITAKSASYKGGAAVRPEIEDKVYNVNGKTIYEVSYGVEHINGFMEVGTYNLTLTLTDTANYCWKDNLNAYQYITFEISKADNVIVDIQGNEVPDGKIQISGWTVDEKPSTPQIRLAYGSYDDIVFEYSTSSNGIYTTEIPTGAGVYYVRAVMAASQNYNAYVSDSVRFMIARRTVTLPVVKNPDQTYSYTGEMLSLDIINYDDNVMSLECDLFTKNSNGTLTLSALNAGKYTATLTLRNTTDYAWADESATTNGKVVINWTIERQVIKVLVSDGRKIVVTGEDIVFIPDGFNSGIMTIRDNVRATEGQYSAVITLKDKANYVWEGIDGDTITVNFELTGTNTVFVALICVAAGLCVGLGVMALVMTLVHRRKKIARDKDIDSRSRNDGWNE